MEPESEETVRRKRLSYRAWHRGMKEMDLILGRFADARLASMSGAEMEAFEAIIACPDVSLYRWISGSEAAPARHDTPLLREIRRASAK